MSDRTKQAVHLYHTTFISKKFKVSLVVEFVFWLVLGYYFCFQNANVMKDVGVMIGDHEHVVSICIKILMPVVFLCILLGYTQAPIYSFLSKDKSMILYKMFPKSYEQFEYNIKYTFLMVAIAIPLVCILYMLLFTPSVMYISIYIFSLMLPISACIIFFGIRYHISFLIWDMIALSIYCFVTIVAILVSEALYSNITMFIIFGFICFILCVAITYKFIHAICQSMKKGWKL